MRKRIRDERDRPFATTAHAGPMLASEPGACPLNSLTGRAARLHRMVNTGSACYRATVGEPLRFLGRRRPSSLRRRGPSCPRSQLASLPSRFTRRTAPLGFATAVEAKSPPCTANILARRVSPGMPLDGTSVGSHSSGLFRLKGRATVMRETRCARCCCGFWLHFWLSMAW